MQRKFFIALIVFVFSAGFNIRTVAAQEPFYAGKNILIIVGFSPGGGYDTYARVIARHLGKHIPGNPAVSVDNMPGAGSLISANHIYKIAKPDGLTIGHFIGGLFLQQLLGKPGVEFDARRFEYIGVPGQDEFVIGLSKTSGITSAQQWLGSKTPVKLGRGLLGFGDGRSAQCFESHYRAADPARLGVQGNLGHPAGVCQRRDSGVEQFMAIV
jgi:tripartite-type tricarboxylate transporter receptor subunit TctC